MKRLQGILVTTHLLPDGTRFTREDLERQVDSAREYYIPVNIEHDIRIPPVGRVIDVSVVQLEDGEYALMGTTELFASDDEDSALENFRGDGRTIVVCTDEIETFKVEYDASFVTPEDKDFIEEITRLSGSDENMSEMLKFSMEPVSVLLITAGIFLAGNVAVGFLQKVGADGYDSLKRRLGRFYHGKNVQPTNPQAQENILDFRFAVEKAERKMEVHLLLSNPTQEQINSLF